MSLEQYAICNMQYTSTSEAQYVIRAIRNMQYAVCNTQVQVRDSMLLEQYAIRKYKLHNSNTQYAVCLAPICKRAHVWE